MGAETARPEDSPDIRAFDALYREHSLHVYRYLRARVASDDEAAELTSVTFEHALRAFERSRPDRDGGERLWLIRIARNASIDAARKSRRLALRRVDSTSPATGTGSIERLVELRVMVESLSDDQRDAIHLRYAGGLTSREIGAVIGRSEAAAQKLITRALAALREVNHDDE